MSESAEAAVASRPLALNRNFVLLWAGQFVSQIGDRLAMVAFPWLVYKSTDSAFSTGVVLALYALPYVLFGAVAGVAIDRFNKRVVMIVADLLRAALVLCVPLIATHSLVAVYLLGFTIASVGVLFDPCKLAILPDLVPKNQLMRANSFLATGETLTEIIGYSVAGFIAYYLSTRVAFSVDSITFVVSAIALGFMSYRPEARGAATRKVESVRRQIAEGLAFVRQHTGLLANTVLVVAAALGLGASYPLTFLYAARVVGGGAKTFGILESAVGLGYLVGSLVMASAAARVRKGVTMTAGLAVLGAAFAVVGAISTLAAAVVPFFIMGAADAATLISIDTYFQEVVPEQLRGRVWGVRFTLTQGVYALSVLVGGGLAMRYDVQSLFIAFGVAVAIPALVGLYIAAVRRA